MKKRTIAILFGGKSSEYSVSLESAYAVLSHIDKTRYDIYMVGITQKGEWFHFEGDIEKIKNDTWKDEFMNHVMICPEPQRQSFIELTKIGIFYKQIDAIMPIMHGKNGEDGTLQGIVTMANIPLIGCGVLSSSLCMDKYRAHEIVEKNGIQTPYAIVASTYNIQSQKEKIFNMNLPLYIKPVHAGSSYGMSRIDCFEKLDEALKEAFHYDDEVIIEEEVHGFEVGCAIMGIEELTVGRVDEIELTKGFFDFKEKYTLQTSSIHMPARIPQEIEMKVQETAKRIYRLLGCRVFARVDMFLTPSYDIVFNEVNTIPGFTSHSRYPHMMQGIGMDFQTLITQLIEMGLQNANNTNF